MTYAFAAERLDICTCRRHAHPAASSSLLSRAVSAVMAWRQRSAQRQALLELDDRLLTDIGVSRMAAQEEAGKPFWK